jgi:hypothetical protein
LFTTTTLQNLSKQGNNQIMCPEWQSPKRLIIVNSADHNRIILSKHSRNKERVIVAGWLGGGGLAKFVATSKGWLN